MWKTFSLANKSWLRSDYCLDSGRTQYLSQISESISQFHRKNPTLARSHHPFIMASQRSYTASLRNWPNLVKDQWKMRTRRGFITPIPGRTKIHNLRMKKISMLFWLDSGTKKLGGLHQESVKFIYSEKATKFEKKIFHIIST